MFHRSGEVATFHLYAYVVIEEDGDAGSGVGIGDGLILIPIDAAVERMEVAIAGVDIDARVDMLGAALGGLC